MSRIIRRVPMAPRRNEGVMPDPSAYFITWPTYGAWLPGDERGWVEYRAGWMAPDPTRKRNAEMRMTERACIVDPDQRRVTEETIRAHCMYRNWMIHAVNCRSNHVHVVVTATIAPKHVVAQLKSWSTRRLKELDRMRLIDIIDAPAVRDQWWAERGSLRWINDGESLERAINYVRDAQDRPRGQEAVSNEWTLKPERCSKAWPTTNTHPKRKRGDWPNNPRLRFGAVWRVNH